MLNYNFINSQKFIKIMKPLKFLFISILILLLIPTAFSLRGVGLQYGTTAEIVPEDSKYCINYGVYNPWDEDVYIKLSTTGELSNFSSSSESKFVPAGTFHDKSIPVQICFDIENVYSRDCVLFLACEKKCPEERVEFNGIILAAEDKMEEGVRGTGSSTSVSASAPLKLIVSCEEEDMNYIPLVALLSAVIVIIVAAIRIKLIMKKPRKKRTKKRKK